MVEIICNDERHRRKLIFTNSRTASNAEVYEKVIKEMVKRCLERSEPFQFNVTQTRNKFKKLMSTCKTALMTQKTASGIKRFQDQKELGHWFNTLLPLMKTRESCQPERAVEPSSGEKLPGSEDIDTSEDTASSSRTELEDQALQIDRAIVDDIPEKEKSSTSRKDLYVPVKAGSSGKGSRSMAKKIEATNHQVNEVLGQIKTIIEAERNSTKEILDFFEKENERSRQHELEIFKIMFQTPAFQHQIPPMAMQGQQNLPTVQHDTRSMSNHHHPSNYNQVNTNMTNIMFGSGSNHSQNSGNQNGSEFSATHVNPSLSNVTYGGIISHTQNSDTQVSPQYSGTNGMNVNSAASNLGDYSSFVNETYMQLM